MFIWLIHGCDSWRSCRKGCHSSSRRGL